MNEIFNLITLEKLILIQNHTWIINFLTLLGLRRTLNLAPLWTFCAWVTTSSLSSQNPNLLASSHSSSKSETRECSPLMMTKIIRRVCLLKGNSRELPLILTSIQFRRVAATWSRLSALFPSPSSTRSLWGERGSLGPSWSRPSAITSYRRAHWGTTTCFSQRLATTRRIKEWRAKTRLISNSVLAIQFWECSTWQIFWTATRRIVAVSNRKPRRRTRPSSLIISGSESPSWSLTSTNRVSADRRAYSIKNRIHSQLTLIRRWINLRDCLNIPHSSRWGRRAPWWISHAWTPSFPWVPRHIPHFKGWMRIIAQSGVINESNLVNSL